MDLLEEIDSLFNDHFGIHENRGDPQDVAETSAALITEDIHADPKSDDGESRDMESDIIQYVRSTEDFHSESDGESEDQDGIRNKIRSSDSCNCMKQLNQSDVFDNILSMRELSKQEKDMHIMGVMRPLNDSETTRHGKRKTIRYGYSFQGKSVCRDCFKIIFDIGEKSLRNLKVHMDKNGPVPRIHGNVGKKPKHALTYEDTKKAVDFIVSYAGDYGIPQPAAPRGRSNLPTIFLPSSDTKINIFKCYEKACSEAEVRSIGLSSFKDLWLKCCPHIKISSPRDDVCQKCEIFRRRIQDAFSEEEKLAAASEFKTHIEKCQMERQVYVTWIKDSLDELHQVIRPIGIIQPLSTCYKKMHYTFDYSKNLTIPHSARQMGPIYFVSPVKVYLFGVRLDGVPVQYNYLFDERQTIGMDGLNSHGANSVISMIHHTFENYGYGEVECGIHADNCGGQNKNKFVMAYLCWRVLTGLHRQITFMMQVAGHARCLVDSGFAHIKKIYRRNDADTLQHIAELVERSSVTNKSVLFENSDGTRQWEWFDWKAFFSTSFMAIKGIQQYQHFRFTNEDPGAVFVKKSSVSEEQRVVLLKVPIETFDTSSRPEIIFPAGISEARAKYIFRHIRPFVRPQYQDVTCPRPVNINEE